MSKKQRRKQSHRAQPPAQSAPAPVAAVETPQEAPVAAAPVSAAPARRVVATPRGKAQPTWQDFSERYSYVNRELKQIGILAGSFLVVLLILTAILG